MTDHPSYRPYALLAFATTVCVGTPLGLWLLAAHHAGRRAVPLPWVFVHTHAQILGFFGTLIVGIAPQLLARFTGRPLPARGAPVGALVLATALVLRVAGTATSASALVLVAAALEAAVFTRFAISVWRMLDPPPLAHLRRHLVAASAWLAIAPIGEAIVRLVAIASGTAPLLPWVHGLHLVALLGGVVGWVLGVLLRAGPMVVAAWAPSDRLAAVVPWVLGAGAVLASDRHGLFARIGDLLVVGVFAATIVTAGAFRRVERALPPAGRSGDETRMFKLAAASLIAAAVGAATSFVTAVAGTAVPLLPDLVRHLLTIGVLASVTIAMSFRLLPVLEERALPFPGLRRVALVTLAGAVIARSAQLLVPYEVPFTRAIVVLSGFLAWAALACVAVTLVAMAVPRRAAV